MKQQVFIVDFAWPFLIMQHSFSKWLRKWLCFRHISRFLAVMYDCTSILYVYQRSEIFVKSMNRPVASSQSETRTGDEDTVIGM